MSEATTAFIGLDVHKDSIAKKRHELLGMSKASEIAEFGDQRDGGDQVNAAQRHQRPDHRLQAPLSHLLAQRLRDSIDPFVGRAHRRAVLNKGDVLRGMGKAHRGKPALVCRRSGTLAGITESVTQQHRLELLTRFEARADRILTRSRQVTDRLVGFLRDHDRRQIAGPSKMRKCERIAAISLDPITGFARDHGRRYDLASIAARTQLTRQAVAARTGLVHDQQFRWSAAMRQGLLGLEPGR